jgi:hypothetical protein
MRMIPLSLCGNRRRIPASLEIIAPQSHKNIAHPAVENTPLTADS